MRTRTATTAVTAALLLAALTACGTEPAPAGPKPAEPTPAAPATKAAPSAVASSPTWDAGDREEARESAGLPPTPDAATRTAYLAALDAIDTDVVHGKNDKAVSRGRLTCADLKRYPGGEAKQVRTATKRWSAPPIPRAGPRRSPRASSKRAASTSARTSEGDARSNHDRRPGWCRVSPGTGAGRPRG